MPAMRLTGTHIGRIGCRSRARRVFVRGSRATARALRDRCKSSRSVNSTAAKGLRPQRPAWWGIGGPLPPFVASNSVAPSCRTEGDPSRFFGGSNGNFRQRGEGVRRNPKNNRQGIIEAEQYVTGSRSQVRQRSCPSPPLLSRFRGGEGVTWKRRRPVAMNGAALEVTA
jgi:hypothetical protein